ncbi:hypothetical protein BDW59DRAFT_161278 [Aspergillus cavernicola]|uniref:Uncharacterized protein n=1 Tax=Aspergillus cavernicola TaxID=176166 RepID=A0ABR4IDR5_9EURO
MSPDEAQVFPLVHQVQLYFLLFNRVPLLRNDERPDRPDLDLGFPKVPSTKSIARSGNVRAKLAASAKGGRKSKLVKSVSFGETTVVSVARWINDPVKKVHFKPIVDVFPVTRWINTPTKRVHFGSTTVIPATPWDNKSAKSVSFGCRKAVIPVTRWIDQQKDVHVPRTTKRSFFQSNRSTTPAPSTAQVNKIGKVPTKPKASAKGGRHTKPVKHVHFGETTVVSVNRWIDRRKNTYPASIPAMGYQLQGWSVTPLSKPDKNGEEERYSTFWGSDSYVMLPKHASKPCDHGQDCSYNYLARIQARHAEWAPKVVFQAWLHRRESIRQKGVFML